MRVRFGQFAAEFVNSGHEVRDLRWAPGSSLDVAALSAKAIRLANWADVLVLLKPRQPPAVITALARINRRLIVDTDDAIWAWNPETARRFRHALGCARPRSWAVKDLRETSRRWHPSCRSYAFDLPWMSRRTDLTSTPRPIVSSSDGSAGRGA